MENGVHYLARAKLARRYSHVIKDFEDLSVRLQSAIDEGDLSENADYDSVKESIRKVTAERDTLSRVLELPVIKANDNVDFIEPGSVIHLTIFGLTKDPLKVGNVEWNKLVQEEPVFDGIVMLGGTTDIQQLLVDLSLEDDSTLGAQLLNKYSGSYSLSVPGGFANLTVKKLKTTSVTIKDLYIRFDGKEYRVADDDIDDVVDAEGA